MDNGNAKKIALVYDKQCPVCDFYCNILSINNTVGELTLVDARQANEYNAEITNRGWDIDQGMVLIVGDNYYYADDAIHMLSLLSTRRGVFNRLNYYIFKNTTTARYVYPLLKSGRNLVMKLLGRDKINNLQKDNNSRF